MNFLVNHRHDDQDQYEVEHGRDRPVGGLGEPTWLCQILLVLLFAVFFVVVILFLVASHEDTYEVEGEWVEAPDRSVSAPISVRAALDWF